MAVSEPDSPSYGAHLSNEAVHALVAPAPSSIAAVMGFLRDHGVVGFPASPNSDIIEAKVTVAQAEKMLATRYHVMVHNESGTKVHRVESYSLPAKVAAAVDFVCPTVHLPPVRKSVAFEPPAAEPNPHPWNTPKHLRELYSIDVEGKAPDNKMAVTAFLNQHYSKSDLLEFWEIFCYGITCGKGDPTVKGDGSLNGSLGSIPCFSESGVCNQSMLDIETITGIAGNIHAEFWGYKGTSPDNSANEPFMKWLSELSNTSDADVPKVFSTSYGEDEDAWSLPAATRMNTEFQKAGARGISLLYASGDEGANCEGINTPEMRFVPETPGSSPWVTSVGGTYDTDEKALDLSSGGFSNRWPMPKWQSAAVATYLKTGKGLPNASLGYNVTGRAYPDIAAQASEFVIIANPPTFGAAGTSCASPTASGVIALINDARLQAGKSVLGFLNPWIYANAKAWNDITIGASMGCRTYVDGWPAAVGWDAVTGVGTPNYKNLVATGGGGGGTVCKYTEYLPGRQALPHPHKDQLRL